MNISNLTNTTTPPFINYNYKKMDNIGFIFTGIICVIFFIIIGLTCANDCIRKSCAKCKHRQCLCSKCCVKTYHVQKFPKDSFSLKQKIVTFDSTPPHIGTVQYADV